ncbi:fatty acid synthase subunit alpha [Achlya hypogyna]|uniref:Fatty acid synthase subunit alpha n=1 Tax=Achlya hypogyna TaxID=1202772 RepID=A0A1V9ZUN2_ACHHY|nr:fatty acid synthase subunit alpha [Achlya hypogyna]
MTTPTIVSSSPSTPALVSSSAARLALTFGGQSLPYIDELALLVEKSPAAAAFVESAQAALVEEAKPFNVTIHPFLWAQDATSRPSAAALASATNSYPLIMLTQFANYLAFLEAAHVKHEEILSRVAAASGHSQGLVTAVLVAAAKTHDKLLTLGLQFVRYMFLHGVHAQATFGNVANAGDVSPMLSVRGLPVAKLQAVVDGTNAKLRLKDARALQVSLVNGKTMAVVTGHPEALALLQSALEKMSAPADGQNRVPFSQRKPTIATTPLDVSVAFHNTILTPGHALIVQELARLELAVRGDALQFPVLGTNDAAANLQTYGEKDVLPDIVKMQLTDAAPWPKTVGALRATTPITHVLDFGPARGAAPLTAPLLEGYGIAVVVPTHLHKGSATVPGLEYLATPASALVNKASWEATFGPSLSTNHDGKRTLHNKYTERLGRQPIWIGGMTPTTSYNGVPLVAAALEAGYIGELACGGLPRPSIFDTKVNDLVSRLTPGNGIYLNLLYLNAKQWAFQFPMIKKMRQEGIPIEGVTVAAGIPTPEKADQVLTELLSVDIKVVSFKPSSIASILEVLTIAQRHPAATIVVQWTGGRAGGHHSFEDFHAPLLATYAAIRRHPNVLLVVGSGFGSAAQSYPYLTGDWSVAFDEPKMPCDGILVASRVMVAKEAATAEDVKSLLVATPGIANEADWETSYDGSAGGVITLKSELGEPIHKIENRGALCWRDFDRKYFSLPLKEAEAAIAADKAAIIARINADFQKPYFGRKASGEVVDLEAMTYLEVLQRMVALMHVPSRWIDVTFMTRVFSFLQRTEQRFLTKATTRAKLVVQSAAQLKTNPQAVLTAFQHAYPAVASALLSLDDVDFFLHLCKFGGKPVNFIPVIDKELVTWFKKDSLWYSEDLEAVVEQDAGRVMILQGPVAVHHITTKNEPVGDILFGMSNGVAEAMAANGFKAHVAAKSAYVPVNGWTRTGDVVATTVGADVDAASHVAALATLVSGNANWLHALLTADHVVSSGKWVANTVGAIVAPRPGQVVEVEFDAEQAPIALRIHDAAVVAAAPVVAITITGAAITLRVSLLRPSTREWPEAVVALDRAYEYKPAVAISPIHLLTAQSEDNIKAFYAQHWLGATLDECQAALTSSIHATHTASFTVAAEDIADYNASLGLSGATAPVDFATVAGWKPLIASVFATEIQGDLLRLVHLSHAYEVVTTGDAVFAAGDVVTSTGSVTAMRNTPSGKVVTGVVAVAVNGVALVRVTSEFLIRGKFEDHHNTFEKKTTRATVVLADKAAAAILTDKAWFKLSEGKSLKRGDTLRFELQTSYVFADGVAAIASLDVQGKVYTGPALGDVIGSVYLVASGVTKDPIAAYLERMASAAPAPAKTAANLLEVPFTVHVPAHAQAYAQASRDLNPIHRCGYSAALASLPESRPIMHGMWTATKVRNLLMDALGSQFHVTKLTSFAAEFKGMVQNDEQLFMQVTQTGVRTGELLLSINVANLRGEAVLGAKAAVPMPLTAFVFTGQGSAEVGMGMQAYASSRVVKEVWDAGDRHLMAKFGFSILQIVRQNPKSITIYFGGKKGMAIRNNYMALVCEKTDADGVTRIVPLIPEITPNTQSFTFSAPTGLLFATQFSQPALVLMEKATYTEAKAAGVIADGCYFAGHSLGEYAALSSFADVLATSDLAEVVFLRGMVMQNAVERDAHGMSDYGMVAANPARVGSRAFDESTLFTLLDVIEAASGQLCQVVNYNVQDSQYVVAGELVNLEVLSRLMTRIREQPTILGAVGAETLVQETLALVRAQKELAVSKGKPFTLKRGTSTIPLVGIDVPFHSKKLLGGVPAFRNLLRPKLKKEILYQNKALLEHHYVPNLVAKPFSLTKEYVAEIVALTGSPSLTPILANWGATPEDDLVHTLVIELLAYQFASPVQWIKTQAYFFNNGLRRFVEIGPSSTLTGMAAKTLQSGKFPHARCDILFIGKDRDVIYYETESEHPSAVDFATSQAALLATKDSPIDDAAPEPVEEATPAPIVVAAPTPVVVAAPAPVAAPAAAIADAPLDVNHVLRVFLAYRFKKSLAEIDDNTTIHALAAGKSAAQNEVVGELEKEFGGGVDRVPELPLSVLSTSFKSYSSFGAVFSALTTDFVRKQMPGGFNLSQVKAYLGSEFGLGAGRTDSVLMHSLLFPPAARHANEAAAKAWLDTVVADYAKVVGVPIAKGGPAPAAGGMMMMPAMGAPVALEPVPEADITAAYALKVFLAHKFKKPLSAITDASSVHELAAGKSAVQNEVVAEMEVEFGGGVDGVAETKLGDLAPKLGSYNKPGKYFTATVAKLLSSKLPGGFSASQLRAFMAQERCLGPNRVEIALIHSLVHAPEARFATDAEAKAWINTVVDDYATVAGVSIPYASKAGAAAVGGVAMGGGGGGVSSAALSALEGRMSTLFQDQVSAFQTFMSFDPLDSLKKTTAEEAARRELEAALDLWVSEMGETFEKGIKPKFDANKVRVYDSSWNWVMQDALDFYYKSLLAPKDAAPTSSAQTFDRDNFFAEMSAFFNSDAAQLSKIGEPQGWFKPFLCNRATPELLAATEYFAHRNQVDGHTEYAQAIELLNEEVEKWLHRDPVHLQLLQPIQPQVTIEANGNIVYTEVPRGNTSVDYVDELSRGFSYRVEGDRLASPLGGGHATVKVVRGLEMADLTEDGGADSDPNSVCSEPVVKKRSVKRGSRIAGAKLRGLQAVSRKMKKAKAAAASSVLPYVHVRKPDFVDPTNRVLDEALTREFLLSMHDIASAGVSFVGKNALVTGCGKDSIAIEVVKALLEGGATVICTTSSFSARATKFFRSVYEQHGARGSRLILLPFNQASAADVTALVQHVYGQLHLDLDFVIPFGAISVVGPTLADIDSKSELAHRIMLTNTYRLLGQIIEHKRAASIETRPCLALLPLSPNHGTMGGDGLYAEAKLGLEALMNKWHSEGWEDYVSIGGAVIGWTRGTGLMAGNNMVSAGIEKLGVRTFSTTEMAFNLTSILHPRMVAAAAKAPLWVDLGGAMGQLHDLKVQTDNIRSAIMEESMLRKASVEDRKRDADATSDDTPVQPRANMYEYYAKFPALPAASELAPLGAGYRGMIDFDKTVVVVGFGEVGPWGNSRTRWEMESFGVFSLEGCIELAWLLGYITYHNGPLKSGEHYIGWVDAKTKDPVADTQVKALYEESILEHAGIRVIEPALFEGYDPSKKLFLQQVAVDKNMRPIEVASHDEALEFQRELGEDNVDVYEGADGVWMIRLRQGAVLSIPKALRFNRFVAGQIPTGWDAKRLGIPADIADAVDPVTLFTLVSTAEALICAGVTDPYEFYQYVHVSAVGNTSGSGMGGMRSLKRIYHERALAKNIPSDSLQECFINTMAAWVNMLLLSSSGPIKTPVGACATAAESVDIGVETILSGKARVVIVGGYDDFGEEGSYEFAQMKATSDADKETSMGRDPREMCRPCTDTRGGFMEAQGAGIQVLMDAALAVEMGCPIYGIVGATNTATDKNGRSVPSPGQGILTTAREFAVGDDGHMAAALLNPAFRRSQFEDEVEAIDSWKTKQLSAIAAGKQTLYPAEVVERMAAKKLKAAQRAWGHDFYKGEASIAPMRGALNAWGLTIDDVGVTSFHGTGTNANDKNESEITQKQLEHLGRTPGNPIMVVCQKYLTGHPKGAAAAWMFNGLLQVMQSGLVPGNANNDNTAPELHKFDLLVYPNRAIQTDGVKAAMLKSFGFGQAGGEVLVIHPNYLLAAMDADAYAAYCTKRAKRLAGLHTYYQGVLADKHSLVQVKDHAPYTAENESAVYLNPNARAAFNPKEKTWTFGDVSSEVDAAVESGVAPPSSAPVVAELPKKLLETSMASSGAQLIMSAGQGLGIDVEPIATFADFALKQTFLARNFTPAEIAYCEASAAPAASFAGRWAAKEAVVKAICNANPTAQLTSGPEAPLIDIEIGRSTSGAPTVTFTGRALAAFQVSNLSSVKLSISHSGDYAVAQALVL